MSKREPIVDRGWSWKYEEKGKWKLVGLCIETEAGAREYAEEWADRGTKRRKYVVVEVEYREIVNTEAAEADANNAAFRRDSHRMER